MILLRRKQGSTRGARPIKLYLQNYNTAGQGGTPQIIFEDDKDPLTYYTLELEDETEHRELLSAVQKAGAHV